MPKETFEEKRARLLAHVHEGELDFAATMRRSRPAPEVVVPPAAAILEPETPLHASPDQAEPFRFSEPKGARNASLRARGWQPGNSLYDPAVRSAAMQLAADLGIHFAELQNVALGLLVDRNLRPPKAEEMLQRLRRHRP